MSHELSLQLVDLVEILKWCLPILTGTYAMKAMTEAVG